MTTQQLILSLVLATVVFSIAGTATGHLVRTNQVSASRLQAKSASGPFHTCVSSYFFNSNCAPLNGGEISQLQARSPAPDPTAATNRNARPTRHTA